MSYTTVFFSSYQSLQNYIENMFLCFFLLSSFFTIIDTSEADCLYSKCGNEMPRVEFPFTLEGQQDRSCGYPGFNLSCQKTNGTLIDLGASGKFFIRLINYAKQEVQIYDQDNCLPKRLISLDLSNTPFRGHSYHNFNFFNCTSNFTSDYPKPIRCLSTTNYTVYAASSVGLSSRSMFQTCDLFASALVPTWEVYDQVGYVADINDDLHLLWDTPNCRECVVQGGKCGFKNRNNNQIGCFNLSHHGISRVAKYILSIGLGVPAFVFVVLISCYGFGNFRSNGGNNIMQSELSLSVLPQPDISAVGLDESVIESYSKTVLGESLRLVKPDDSTCAICLSEYRAKDIVKTIPDCRHCFHAACVDQWLRINVTCPLCRKAPTPVPSPVRCPAPILVL